MTLDEDLLTHNIKEIQCWKEQYDLFVRHNEEFLEFLTEAEVQAYFTCNVYSPHKGYNQRDKEVKR